LLAFDHKEVVAKGLERLRGKVRYQPIGFELLPKKFTLGQLQLMYECILGRPLDKRNFRKKILTMGILTPLEDYLPPTKTGGRKSRLYRFDRKSYQKLVKSGFNFEV
jgi:8-oxo-dGTP diphosphatase